MVPCLFVLSREISLDTQMSNIQSEEKKAKRREEREEKKEKRREEREQRQGNMDSIKLLTFNVWGLKYISKYRKQRIEGIVTKLQDSSEDYDVIALQEIWCQEDWQLFVTELKHIYPHCRYFKAGVIAGPGLGILSKVPIKETFLYRFPINGRPSAINRGDWFVGKSLSVTVLTNNLVVLNSHMHAPYADVGDNAYLCHRACQAWDISKIIKLLQKSGYHIILVGDLNSRPGSLPYKLFTIESGLSDSWNQYKLGNNDPLITADQLGKMSPKDQVSLAAVTCNSQLNTWRSRSRLLDACRLDYALINQSLSVIEAAVKFIDILPHYNCSYSDHFAYYVHLKLNKPSENSPTGGDSTLSFQIYTELIAAITEYETHILPRHHIWRFYHFLISIIISIVLIVVSFVFSLSFTPVIMLVILGPGLVNGIILLNYLHEGRALEEVKMEVEDKLRTSAR